MNLDTLRQRYTKTVEINGEAWRIRKLSAADGVLLHSKLEGMEMDENRQLVKPTDMLTFFSFAASKSLVNDLGEPEWDSAEGRDLLARMDVAHIVAIGEACLEWSGLAGPIEDAKKNESSQP